MTHPDDSVQMSGDGESEEGIAVKPLIQFVSIPANSLQALHKSAKRRVRLTAVDTAASVITTIMPADGVDTSPNMINIAGKRDRSWSEEVVDEEFASLDQFTFIQDQYSCERTHSHNYLHSS